MNKNQLRQHIKHLRHQLTPEQQAKAAQQVAKQVFNLNRYRLSRHIAFYQAQQGELDPSPILQHALAAGKHCYLPLLHPNKTNTLCFMPYHADDKLAKNRFDILEPIYDAKKVCPAWHLDIVFTPLVAFDAQGNRLGMGQGYYDRTFAFLNTPEKPDKPCLIGLAYEMQKVANLVAELHDVSLQQVITEKIKG